MFAMADEIDTHYIKGGFASAGEIELHKTKTTRTVFRPAIHSGGVRGELVRQKIGKDGKWADSSDVDFRKAPPDSGVKIDLDTAGTKLLSDKLNSLYTVQSKGVEIGDQKYIVGKQSEVMIIDDKSKQKAIQELLDKGYSEDFWKSLSKSNPDLATKLAIAQVQVDKQGVIRQFEEAMETHAGDESFWQIFFEKHPWLLESAFSASAFMLNGETYLGGKLPAGRQGRGGVATDYLFGDASTKSFAVVDIKKPNSGLVGPIYRGDAGSGSDNEVYSMHNELSGGVVQVRNQITVAIEHYHSVLGPGFKDKINRIHPKGVLVTGKLEGLSERQRASLNQFRQGQYSLTIITFDELLNRVKKIYGLEYDNIEPGAPNSGAIAEVDLDDIPF